ncbi:hypothetical protein GZH47_22590 [Paenibacillus rhizovicinus]|uniref:Uncharacterized protein n=1 Tax=Paenibacillus rhizovicinus TaxID=2704463 RepID=A0A6C0P445_9BACL|nr:hypothetical protein [Paenibacillus rhizovicinus]QHW33304.1 hypothetical protein GZH47_22590 [Paenibacillus rhizovicinus]
MKEPSSGRFAPVRLRSRLLSAVLIALTLLASAGCGSASDNNSAADSGDKAVKTGLLISDKLSAGENPFLTAGIDDPKKFQEVFGAVKAAIARGDKAEVANHILYPLRVNGASGTELIQTRGEFVKQYDAIMTKQVRNAIASQSFDQLFINYQGVMVGNGEIWFAGSADKPQVIGMIAINHDIGTR